LRKTKPPFRGGLELASEDRFWEESPEEASHSDEEGI
jgi:hypothetical protein